MHNTHARLFAVRRAGQPDRTHLDDAKGSGWGATGD